MFFFCLECKSASSFCLGFYISSSVLDRSAMHPGLENNGFIKDPSCGIQRLYSLLTSTWFSFVESQLLLLDCGKGYLSACKWTVDNHCQQRLTTPSVPFVCWVALLLGSLWAEMPSACRQYWWHCWFDGLGRTGVQGSNLIGMTTSVGDGVY